MALVIKTHVVLLSVAGNSIACTNTVTTSLHMFTAAYSQVESYGYRKCFVFLKIYTGEQNSNYISTTGVYSIS